MPKAGIIFLEKWSTEGAPTNEGCSPWIPRHAGSDEGKRGVQTNPSEGARVQINHWPNAGQAADSPLQYCQSQSAVELRNVLTASRACTDRLEIGRQAYDLGSAESRSGFFSNGMINASLKTAGTTLEKANSLNSSTIKARGRRCFPSAFASAAVRTHMHCLSGSHGRQHRRRRSPDGRHVQRTAGGRHPRTTVEERRWPFITSLDYPIFFILNRYILVTRVWQIVLVPSI